MFVDKPEQRQTPAFMEHAIRNVADLRWTFYRGYGEMQRWGGGSGSVMGNMDFCRLDKLISSVWEEQGKDLLRAKKRRRRRGGTVAV